MEGEELPPGWAWATLGDVCAVNPSTSTDHLSGDDEVVFVPMAAVSELSNQIDTSRRRKLSEVAKGFTKFAPADVLFAKITPCMENGKIAVVPDVPGNVAYGSTEFHVLRPHPGISSSYLYHFVAQQRFRDTARRHMSGAVGQQRVPTGFLGPASLPVPPQAEQDCIAAVVNDLFEELDEAEAALARARDGVEQFRASLLHAACTGQLTAAWRKANPPAETGADLLRRILSERRAAWERTERARLEAKGTPPRGDAWKARYVEPVAPDLTDMPDLPDGWVWASLDQLAWSSSYGSSVKCDAQAEGLAVLRIPNVQTGTANWSNLKCATEDLALAEDTLLAPGDLLIVRTNGSNSLVGRAGLVEITPPVPSYFASYLIRFRLVESAILQRWIATIFGSALVRMQVMRSAATSAGQYNISQTKLASFAMPLPSEPEMQAAIDLLQGAPLHTDDWTAQGDIASLRQSILHAAFTGRLVPQDPRDEPAATLLARLRESAAAAPRKARSTRRS